MEEINNPSQADPSGVSETKGEGSENVSNISVAKAINEATGRDYKSDEDAIRGIKETNSYVGKVGKYKDVIEQIEKSSGGEEKAIEALKSLISTEQHQAKGNSEDPMLAEVNQLKEKTFFLENKELEPHKEVIKNLRKEGQSYEDVLTENKDLIAKLVAYDESQKNKSVIHSNSRIAPTASEATRKAQLEKGEISLADYLLQSEAGE
jgi:hypothetical protein